MHISSTVIALALLRNDGPTSGSLTSQVTSNVAGLTAVEGVSAITTLQKQSSDTYDELDDPEFRMILALGDRRSEAMSELLSGEVGLFDAEIVQTMGGKVHFQQRSDTWLEFEGSFVPAYEAAMGMTAPQRDANFPARSDAMAYAYHFGKALFETINRVVNAKLEIEANSDTMLDASGQLYGITRGGRLFGSWDAMEAADAHGTSAIVGDMLYMERNAASLANLFSFDSASVTKPAYEFAFTGFSISHGTLGKIMDVAADGSITLYGADGKAYDVADYSARNINGGIPELRNDLIRRADRSPINA
ncbi:hypothetical protein ACEUZ9_000480 [Paracoccus litorisediminis]|uniref:hypothetical protein n=1 Tax=Paracoccus litorisediminis TaxID=2006130 RepID=UPI0037307D13